MIKQDDTLALWLAINTGNSGGGETWVEELLWENPDTTIDFPETRIAINTNQYEFIKVEHKFSKSDSDANKNICIFDRTNNIQGSSYGVGIIGQSGVSKRVIQVLANTIMRILSATSWNSNTQSNDKAIPLAIYGIKKG